MERTGMEVAVIGMAARFPQAKNVDEYWDNLINGRDCITHFSDEELLEVGISKDLLNDPKYIKARGYLEGIEDFDPGYFGLSAQDILFMDPQIRLFLELISQTLDHAGINPEQFPGLIGLYAGANENFDWKLKAQLQPKDNIDPFSAGVNSTKDLMTTLASYLFDLRGPSYSMQTACSTSLVSIHTACRSVLSGECQVALAGGVSINPYQKSGHLYNEGMFMSEDGQIRSFDQRATGFVFGYGGGMVALKGLDEAIEDGDFIHGVIKSSAINNDGKQKVGYSAPSVQGQSQVISEALNLANIDRSKVRYIETHGAATPLGDSVEVRALKSVYKEQVPGTIAIGSAKSNIGHLDAGSGIAGFIKSLLIAKNRIIPPTVNFEVPNKNLGFIDSPLYVPQKALSLSEDDYPIYTSVSSLGIGGTNAHIIVEEYQQVMPQVERAVEQQIVLLNAKTSSALQQQSKDLLRHLQSDSSHDQSLRDISYTLQDGRREMKFRRFIVTNDMESLVESLKTEDFAYDKESNVPRKLVLNLEVSEQSKKAFGELYLHAGLANSIKQELVRDLRKSGLISKSEQEIVQLFDQEGVGFYLGILVFSRILKVGIPGGIHYVVGNPLTCMASYVAGEGNHESQFVAFMLQSQFDASQDKISLKRLVNVINPSLSEGCSIDPLLATRLDLKKGCFEEAEDILSDAECILETLDHWSPLQTLGTFWARGIAVNWKAIRSNPKYAKVPLPTYPFERRRFWIDQDIQQLSLQLTDGAMVKTDEVKDWFYYPSWQRTPPVSETVKKEGEDFWLVLENGSPISNSFIQQCLDREIDIIRVSKISNPVPESDFRIDAEKDGFHAVFQKAGGKVFNKIICFWDFNPENTYDPEIPIIAEGYNTVLRLAKGVHEYIDDAITLHWIGKELYSVLGTEIIDPVASTVLGPLSSIPQEQPNMSCQVIDLGTGKENEMARLIMNELCCTGHSPQIAFRGNSRWELSYQQLPHQNTLSSRLKKEGTYVISGGLGNMGFAIAEYLLKTYEANVILLSRGTLPDSSEWPAILKGEKTEVYYRILQFQTLTRHSRGNLHSFRCDISNKEQVEQVFQNIEQTIGPVNGIFHAAGSVSDEVFKVAIEAAPFEAKSLNYRAKVEGTLALWEAIKHRSIDFCLLQSSVSVPLGGLGFSDYSATSHFLDNFAKWANQSSSNCEWLSVEWDSWPFTASKVTEEPDLNKLRMTIPEAGEALNYILSISTQDFILAHSTIDLNQRIAQWVTFDNKVSDDDQLTKAPRPELDTTYEAPATELEKQVADIWRNVLGLEVVGLNDDFFELGGNSLKMIAVVSKIQKELKKRVEIRKLFEALTVTKVVDYLNSIDQEETIVPLEPVAKAPYYAMTPTMANIYLQCQFEDVGTVYNIANGIILEGDADLDRIGASIQKLVDRHEALRTSFLTIEGIPMQEVHDQVAARFEVLQLTKDETVEDLIDQFVQPFDLANKSLFKVGLIPLKVGQSLLMFDMHHIICDGVTLTSLADEFSQLYLGKNLDPIRIHLKDYIAYQEKMRKESSVDFWIDQLKGELPLLNLPTDFERPLNRQFLGTQYAFELDEKEVKALASTTTDPAMTMFIKLMSVTYILLSKYSGQEDVVIGSGVAGRNHEDVLASIGLFFNAFPVRVNAASNRTFSELMEQVKDLMLGIYEHENCDMDQVYRELNVKRHPSRNFLYDVVFLHQNYDPTTLDVGEVSVKTYDIPSKHAQTDITMHAYPKGEGLNMVLTYSTELFKEETMARFGDNFSLIIRQVIERPNILLSEIEIGEIYEKVSIDTSGLDFEF